MGIRAKRPSKLAAKLLSVVDTSLRHPNFSVAVWLDTADCLDNARQHLLNAGPTGGTQNHNGNLSLGQILLVLEVLIGRDQNLKAMILRLLQ